MYPGAKPFYLVGTIPEYFRKVKQGSNKFREVIKRRHPTRDITNVPRFCTKLGVEPSKIQITLAINMIRIVNLKTNHNRVSRVVAFYYP